MTDYTKSLNKTSVDKAKLQIKIEKEIEKHISDLLKASKKKPKDYALVHKIANSIEYKAKALRDSK